MAGVGSSPGQSGATNLGHIRDTCATTTNIPYTKDLYKKNIKEHTTPHHKQNHDADSKPTARPRTGSRGMDASVHPSWFAPAKRPRDHNDAIESLLNARGDQQQSNLRRHKRMFDKPVELLDAPGGCTWPMLTDEPCPFPPPTPTADLMQAMRDESAHLPPSEGIGPLASMWTQRLQRWYLKLQKHFGFNPADLAGNVRRSRHRWSRRLQYLWTSDKPLYESIMSDITVGHKIPFKTTPKKCFRRENPPSLALDKTRAWAAIMKDIAHGALRPVNIPLEGLPHCVCPVRTADKNDGSARFVHNSRKVNKHIPREAVTCELESLMRTRNIHIPGGFAIGSDFTSGYHCIGMFPQHQKYVAFALHVSELPDQACEWLRKAYPGSYMPERKCFVFVYAALPFGLSSSCRAFNNLISALAGFWRRCTVDGEPVRCTSYIDDIVAEHSTFRGSILMAMLMVYEAAALGLFFKIPKCSFFPKHSIKTLGNIVNLVDFTFSVSAARAYKIRTAIRDMRCAVSANWNAIPARLVASFIGLIWSIAPCCNRAASVMLRSVTAVLTSGMRESLRGSALSLRIILRRFWVGTVAWSHDAQRQLEFWSRVRFEDLCAPISADVLGRTAELKFHYPADFDQRTVSFLFQDASESASGGGMLVPRAGALVPASGSLFLGEFDHALSRTSSTMRELMGIKWCLEATLNITNPKVIFLCDNWSACQAICRGSSLPHIQNLAEAIFLWCMLHGKTIWPVWVPRDHSLIQEADRRSRLSIPHDDRSPTNLVRMANTLALIAWREPLSFDQAASHRSAIEIEGVQLPFNAYCMQPNASGVDMFAQWHSWTDNINYVFPPRPMTGRLITFLPTTKSRAVVVFKGPVPPAWWSFAVQPGAHGVVTSTCAAEFIVILFDFSTDRPIVICNLSPTGVRNSHLHICRRIPAHSQSAPPIAGSKESREAALTNIREVALGGKRHRHAPFNPP